MDKEAERRLLGLGLGPQEESGVGRHLRGLPGED